MHLKFNIKGDIINMQNGQVIYEFRKNTVEKCIIEFSKFRGRELIALRVYCRADDNDWMPTQKGISMSIDRIVDLKKGIDKAYKAWEIDVGTRKG